MRSRPHRRSAVCKAENAPALFYNEGYQRPSELQRKIASASRRVLEMQLKEMEQHKLVAKKIFEQMPSKVE